MKKLILPCAIVFLFGLNACEKEPKHLTETINVTLNKNQTYHLTLASDDSDSPYEITTQASHYKTSRLQQETEYTYTPSTDYTGTDRVVIESFVEDSHGHHKGGRCHDGDSEEKTERTYVINFNIPNSNPAPIVNDHAGMVLICPSF
jgi:hypothetical protein